MGRKVNKVITNVTVQDFASEGKCIVRHEGEVVFLNGATIAPGDVVDVEIKRKKKNYSEGYVLRIVEQSAIRTEAFCSHFGVCGGCKWQHIPYEVQLEQKQKQVLDQLQRIGKIEIGEIKSILPSLKTTYYRNKLEYTFANSRWLTREEIESGEVIDKSSLGFHVPKRFDKVIPIEKCYLQPDPSNEIRLYIEKYAKTKGFTFYDHVQHKGFMRSLMIRTSTLGETMVMIQFAEPNVKEIKLLLTSLQSEFSGITSLFYVINQKRNDTVFDLNMVHFSGKEYIEEKIHDLVFRIAPKSFYQTNPEQAVRLYELAADFAELKSTDILYDLYTGTGTIALFMARSVQKVVGVEYVDDAIIDAKVNAEVNGIHNAAFFAGDMKKVLNDEFITQNGKPNVVVVDPPRIGMDKEVTEKLLEIAPERIVYVSCNAATQARDLAILTEKYTVTKSQAVDMFPHTFHVENVVLLTRK